MATVTVCAKMPAVDVEVGPHSVVIRLAKADFRNGFLGNAINLFGDFKLNFKRRIVRI